MTRILDLGTLDFTQWLAPGGFVVWAQAMAEPRSLTRALLDQRRAIGGFSAFVGMTLQDGLAGLAGDDAIHLTSYIAMGENADLMRAGTLDIMPGHYSAIPASLRDPDLLLLSLARGPDGSLAYALACEYLHPLVARARFVLAEVNAQTPWTPTMLPFDASRLSGIIETDQPLPEFVPPLANDAARRIAAHVAALIPDGATLQTGIGTLPDAVLAALSGHRDLGFHSGALGDGAFALMQSGVITNARKPVDTGRSVAGLIHGSRALARDLSGRRDLTLCPISHTHDATVLAQLPRLTTINSAIEVDLTGQINSEIADGRYIGGVGGVQEFNRAALQAEDGLPLIILPSTARRGAQSRIVAQLSTSATIPRSDAGVIVTEHGAADLRGKSLSERRRLMLSLVHPAFADTLAASAAL